MAIIQINSKDPNLGFIIKKNPASGMQLREIRKGMSFGWYSNNNQSFNILFKDADNAVSFGDQEFEYLNTSRYNSSLFVLSAISEFFSSTVKEVSEYDIDGIEKSFIINMVDIKLLRHITHFEKYFLDFKITHELYAAKSYKITVTTNKSFHMLFNYINLLMLFVALTSDEYILLDQTAIEKYLNSIERLDAPFFIRYLFSRNMLKSRKQFEKYKAKLEDTKLYDSVKMMHGDTALQRRNKIQSLLTFNKSILDIGCGEGFYAIPFASSIKEKNYFAIDIDQNLTNIVNIKAEKKDITNIKTFNNIDEFINTYDNESVDIILTEVIEHMPLDESKLLINKILNTINFDNFIITVPNKDFNKFYMIEEHEFRHLDHDWEPTESEFKELIENVIPTNFNVKFLNIGDTVNSISTSIGCIITKK